MLTSVVMCSCNYMLMVTERQGKRIFFMTIEFNFRHFYNLTVEYVVLENERFVVMEISRIIYDQILKSEYKALALKKSLETEFVKSQLSNDTSVAPSLPLIIKEKQYKELKKTSEMLFTIMDKTIGLVIDNQSTGTYIRTYRSLWDVIKKEDTFNSNNIIFARISGVYDKNDTIRYFEFTSEPSDLLLAEELLEIYGNIQEVWESLREINFSFFNKSWKSFARFLQTCNKKIDFNKKKDVIAIISFQENYGDRIYYKYLKNNGFNVCKAKPDEFIFNGTELTYRDLKIKLIIFPQPVKNITYFNTDLKPVIDAFTGGKVFIIDAFRSLLATEKSLFALISDRKNYSFYNDREVKFIKKHIPWTRIIRHECTTDIEGNEVDLIDYIIASQDRLVLKKSSDITGDHLGPACDMNPMDWKTLVSWILSSKELWVAQEKIEFNSSERYVIGEDTLKLKKIFWCVHPYIFNGKFQTCYGKTSDEPVVNADATETLVGFI